jgi:hypothetical protein
MSLGVSWARASGAGPEPPWRTTTAMADDWRSRGLLLRRSKAGAEPWWVWICCQELQDQGSTMGLYALIFCKIITSLLHALLILKFFPVAAHKKIC